MDCTKHALENIVK